MHFHRSLLRGPTHHPIKVILANQQKLPRLLPSSTRILRSLVFPSTPLSVTTTTPLQSQRFFQSSSSVKMETTRVRSINSHDEFKNAIKVDKLVVLDCYATWCGPCRVIAPKIDQFSIAHAEADFWKVDVDEVASVASELGVRAMPTFFFFKNGEKIAEVVGANPAALKAAIDKYT